MTLRAKANFLLRTYIAKMRKNQDNASAAHYAAIEAPGRVTSPWTPIFVATLHDMPA